MKQILTFFAVLFFSITAATGAGRYPSGEWTAMHINDGNPLHGTLIIYEGDELGDCVGTVSITWSNCKIPLSLTLVGLSCEQDENGFPTLSGHIEYNTMTWPFELHFNTLTGSVHLIQRIDRELSNRIPYAFLLFSDILFGHDI